MSISNLSQNEKADKAVVADIVEVQDCANDKDATTPSAFIETWQPGLWRNFPLIGLGCLVASGAISNVALIFLLHADGTAMSKWVKWGYVIAPNVILSILNGVANLCITIAAVQGVATTWWRKAVHGATIKDLHNTWSFGDSPIFLLKSLKQPKHLNLAALAALVVKLTVVDSILYQRSLSTYITQGPSNPKNITAYPATSLPVTGRLNTFGNDTDFFTSAFTVDIEFWLASANNRIGAIYGFVECEGICFLKVSTPGYIASCSYNDEDIDIISYAAAHAVSNTTQINTVTDVFDVDFSLNFATAEKNYTWIGVNTTSYTAQDRDETNTTQNCPATLRRQQCELRQAMLTYPVYLETTNVSTLSRNQAESTTEVWLGFVDETSGTYQEPELFNYSLKQVPGFKFENYIDSSAKPTSRSYIPDGGIYLALKNRYKSRAYVTTYSNNPDWETSTEGQYAAMMQEYHFGDTEIVNSTGCPSLYGNPLYDIIPGLNMLTFITSNNVNNRFNTKLELSVEESEEYFNRSQKVFEATERLNEIHYGANKGWWIAAIVTSLVCHLLVLPSYWGFWKLGRKVSFNPIEIANAFQAPTLVTIRPKSGRADDVVKVAEEQQVKYTQILHDKSGKGFKFVSR